LESAESDASVAEEGLRQASSAANDFEAADGSDGHDLFGAICANGALER